MASPPQVAGPQAAAAAGGDPSMEDILASIRRILTEDEAAPAAPAPPPVTAAPPAEAPPDDDGVLDLSEAMLVSEQQEPPPDSAHPPAAPEPAHDATISDEFLEPHVTAPMPGAPVMPDLEDEQHLVAPEAAAAAASSVSQLVRRLSIDRASAVYRGGPTIEDVVREEMRPLLKGWLDENLPPLVERLVRAEIERVVARGLQ